MTNEMIIGKTFNMLTVISFDSVRKGHRYYLCECSCGNMKIIMGSNILSSGTKSCGCLKINYNLKHGHAKRSYRNRATSTYSIWSDMKGRCLNKNVTHFKYYGGRGIKVCKHWMKFENFLKDMGERPKERSLDRINNDGDYKPSNCRWATIKQQNRNTRRTKFVIFKGKKCKLADLCDKFKVNYKFTYQRLYRGWDL